MSNISPIFPIANHQHFDDYGFHFNPQVDYFQVVEGTRKHKRETSGKSSIRFKIQKTISKDDPTRITMHNNKIKKKKRWWWKKAFPFFKWSSKWPTSDVGSDEDRRRDGNFRALSMPSPVYSTECVTGSITPYRMSKPSSTRKGDVEIPYLSLRELNVEQQQRISTSSFPIYLVT